ncbi:anaphase promoting complex subunit 1 isoform X2 [Megachile rotundata]|uniref:anaphase promoting complex subunit 1 isoform X2 n=1 Tax=Megachile rotundata TaxID=143995 RepID=UPI000614B49C|nr:PREDICTED: anaphase-promoting complex subunit 1 isoform X2 [Megachile rotundata]
MIAASEPVEYIPGGRQTILRHPESIVNQHTLSNQIEGDSILLQKFSRVNISEGLPREFWIVRENDTCGEEELYCSGKIAIHSKGNQTTRVLQTSYTCETDIKHALWCKFHANIPDRSSKAKEIEEEENDNKTVECICLIDSYTLKVFSETGEDYVSSLQFQVSAVWPTKYGILLEKTQVPVTEIRYMPLDGNRLQSHNDINLPIAFSLMHPLDEICPVLIKHGNISYMYDSNQQILFTSSEPSLAVIYDAKTGLHSVYKIRKALAEECQIVCGSNDTTPSIFNHSSISSLNIGSNLSYNKNCTNKGHLSIFGVPNPQLSIGLGISNSPFSSRTSYTTTCSGGPSPSQQQQQHSRSQSPMATISRCQSPTHSAFSPLLGASGSSVMHHNRLHQAVMTTALSHTQNSPFGNFNNMQLQDIIIPSKPLYPEICLDHVWTENVGIPKDTASCRASKVFLSSDLVGQSYLCYLAPYRSQLFLVRLEKTNKQQQIIFGMVTSIVAKDAVNVPNLHMIATMDLANGVVLYSGVTCIGKLHVTGIFPNLTGCNYFLSSNNHKLGSPFPRRSSLISQNYVASHDIKFEEGLHLLSPVSGNCARPPILLENSLIDSNFLVLKETVGNKVTLEYGSKNYFRITLPTSSTSPLVTKCLQTLRSVLQKDLAMQLLVKWYGARNAPGPQDFSPEQEWCLFLIVLFTLLGYEVEKLQLIQKHEKDQLAERNSPMVVPKKQKTNNSGSSDDWKYMINLVKGGSSQTFISNILGLQKTSSTFQMSIPNSVESNNAGKINVQSILFPYFPLVLFSLHLLYEELKLNSVMSESLPLLAQLLYQLSSDLRFDMYTHHYFVDFPSICQLNFSSQIKEADLQKITIPNYIPSKPPNIFETLNNLLNCVEVAPFPYLSQVNQKTKNIIYLMALIANENKTNILEIDKFVKHIISIGSRIDFQEGGNKYERELLKKIEYPAIDRIVLLYHEMGMNKKDLETLPPGVSLVLKDVMHRCRERPPSNWPMQAYELVDRQDLAALDKHIQSSASNQHMENEGKNYSIKDPEQDDGMEFDDAVLKLRFNKDHRIAEVRKLLNSSKPVRIAIVQRPDVSDHEFIEEQEKHLHALCTRTMALPVARGMFTLRTSTPIITEQLPIPRLCLTGKAPPRGTTIELAHIDVPPNMNLWPLFHNGVAAGLRIHPDASNIDSTWIVYNKQQQGEFGIEHSGFLMALGLNGHLKNLAPLSMYEYLVECHEATSVGLLLGLSATHRGTMNVSMTKLLSLHVETLLPPTSIELNVQQNVQVAALMGVGLVYQGTAHRHISHALLSEIGRPPGPEMKNCVDRESYSLAAGLALGLVVLRCGSGSDLANIPDTLHYYMVGGHVRPFTGAQKDKYKSPSYQIREGDSINIDVTSPGATIALGLMYFNTGNRAVAEWMQAPDTQYLLDFVRPDFLLLRILAKSLILWDEIEPTKSWVSSHVPNIVYKYRLQKPTSEIAQSVDLETMNQAYCNIIAGACMALGLKYAGTANKNAFKTLYNYAQMFTALSHKTIAELAGKSTIETCLNVTLLSAAVVMAGTGNLEIMRICRHIRTRVGPASSVVTYGSHLATHMALGLLFLGGGKYTLSNSPSAVAALIISLFPKFPTHSNDNRYHLQALRHLYVLAAEPRVILPRDIDSGQYCYAMVHLTFASEKEAEGQDVVLQAPCLLPQLCNINKLELKDDRYWEIVFEKNHNWQQLESVLKNCEPLSVKQRAGCLPYIEDPHGFRSLIAQTLTTENVIAWAARPECVTSFTNDKTVLNIVKYFLQWPKKEKIKTENKLKMQSHGSLGKSSSGYLTQSLSDTSEKISGSWNEQSNSYNEKMEIADLSTELKDNSYKSETQYSDMSEFEEQFLHAFAIIVYECVIKDKVSLLPLWVTLLKSLEISEKEPNSFSIWQIKLVSSYMLEKPCTENRNPLLSAESVLAIQQKISFIMDSWEHELTPYINSYLTTGSIQGDITLLRKMCSYFVFYDIPHKMDYQTVLTLLLKPENRFKISNITLCKLYKILKSY